MAKEKLRIAQMLPLEKEIEIAEGQTITVHPISLTDIIELFSKYQESFLSLFVEGQKDAPQYETFVVGARDLISEIIARAADRMDELEDIWKLPGTVQLIAFSEIWAMSVPNPKKLVGAMLSLFDQLQKLRSSLQSEPPTASPTT